MPIRTLLKRKMLKFDIHFCEFSFQIQSLLQCELSKGGELQIPASPNQLLLSCSPSLPSFQSHPGLISRGTNTQPSTWSCEHQKKQNSLQQRLYAVLFRSGAWAKRFWDLFLHHFSVICTFCLGRWECYFPMCIEDLAWFTRCVWAKQGNEKDKNLRDLAFQTKTESTAHSGMKNWQVPKRRFLLPT